MKSNTQITSAIPFLDLPAQYNSIKDEINEAIQGVLNRCDYVGGSAVEEFETEFAEFCQTKHCVGVSNGTDALYLALKGLGIGAGDEVITVPNTFIATAASVSRTGATVRFVDVVPTTLQMDVTKLERTITHRTKAILPVHLYGQFSDMDTILTLARQHEIHVVEDAAQAHGASYHDRIAGSMGIAGCFSFYPGKVLGACGDGGAITTNDEKLALYLRRLRDLGRDTKYEHLEIGYNHRLDTMQAAILKVKLRHLAAWVKRRQEIAALYCEYLQDCSGVKLLQEAGGQKGAYHLLVVQVENREQVQKYFNQHNIAAGVHYPLPLHLQPAYKHLGYQPGAFPVTEAAAERVLSLPIYPEMSDAMVEHVAEHLEKAVA